jgi:hypothetical protein
MMESDNAVLILGANLLMYAVARGWAKSGDSHWMSAFKQGLSKPLDSEANRSMDELRKKMEELQKNTTNDH